MNNAVLNNTHHESWHFRELQRWEINAILETTTPMHIGSGELLEKERMREQYGDTKIDENINAVIRGKGDLPIIPGSTIKGKLRSYLFKHLEEKDLQTFHRIFGESFRTENNHGRGGVAEFHDAQLVIRCTSANNYPNWSETQQTYMEASTAINRHTKTAREGSLHYRECIAPKTQFKLIITGDMQAQDAALIVKTLQLFAHENSLKLGSGSSNEDGRMTLINNINVALLGQAEISKWLKGNRSDKSPADYAKQLQQPEIDELIKQSPQLLPESKETQYPFTLQFDGPFIVNDPTQEKDGIDHNPLLDSNKNPVLPVKSFRGALRAQAERIIRTMGGNCCDPDADKACNDIKNLCIACELFGATGWKTTLNISHLEYQKPSVTLPPETQQHVALDRFHGGGKNTALFITRYLINPQFIGSMSLCERKGDKEKLKWKKGLLALLFRDLKEGDISFGFGTNKGYGKINTNATNVENTGSIQKEDIQAFRDLCENHVADQKPVTTATPENNPAADQLADIIPPQNGNNIFHNPYHFIPTKQPDTTHWFELGNERNNLNQSTSPQSHAVYRDVDKDRKPLHHGRITCTLTSQTPFFIGGHDKDSTNTNTTEAGADIKENFRLNGSLAIPATSLRGMISAITEAASNSAMRVLDNGFLSYRKAATKGLSAIGMIVYKEKHPYLIPLALPTLRGNLFIGKQYREMFPDGGAKLKVYLEGAVQNPSFSKYHTWTRQNHKVYYLPLSPVSQTKGVVQNHTTLKRPSRNNRFVIGQRPNNNPFQLSEENNGGMAPGILRILGRDGRIEEMPATKEHELFIPVPQSFVDNVDEFMQKAKAFPITEAAIKNFEGMAKERTTSQNSKEIDDNQRLPYHLKGTRRNSDKTLTIKTGDLVYFEPNTQGTAIEEISFSSIWRNKVPKSTHAFFPEDLLPFNNYRKSISPAELLFGFVELNDSDNPETKLTQQQKDKRKLSKAFAGKVTISTGLLSGESATQQRDDLLCEADTLIELSSPKLPSPALYFKNTDGGHIAKSQLGKGNEDPQGRKYYLHQSNFANKPWKTNKQPNDNNHGRQVQITPIKEQTSFQFHVDFSNLNDWELGLLLYSLNPDNNFQHKLGMGRPIGLGSVKIDIDTVQTINRKERYSNDVNQGRYNAINWNKKQNQQEISDKIQLFTNTMDNDIRQALKLLGNPDNVQSPVHYPQQEHHDLENKNYDWFVTNDQTEDQALQALSANSNRLPTLTR